MARLDSIKITALKCITFIYKSEFVSLTRPLEKRKAIDQIV